MRRTNLPKSEPLAILAALAAFAAVFWMAGAAALEGFKL